MKDFSLIIAVDNENGIGKNGTLAWRIPKDTKYFQEITTKTQDPNKQNAVIMGRKTWESIPQKYRPLPDRYNAVLSRSHDDYGSEQDGMHKFKTVSGTIKHIGALKNIEEIFIIGGAEIYNTVLQNPQLTTVYLTRIYEKYHCDSFFQSLPLDFERISQSEMYDHKGVKFEFLVYKRKNGILSKVKSIFGF